MDGFGFVASLVGSLAWPAAAVVLAVLFRSQIAQILGRAHGHVRAGPFEADWSETVNAAHAALGAKERIGVRSTAGPDARLILAEVAPVQALLDAYHRVEQALSRSISAAGVPIGTDASLSRLTRVARNAGLIPERTADALHDLVGLRNLAVHGPADEIDGAKAKEFIALADATVAAIETPGEPDHHP